MLEALHEWLAHYGFAVAGAPIFVWIAWRWLHSRSAPFAFSSAVLAELRKRYPHDERARASEEIEIECRPSDARAWGRLRARTDERGLDLRLRSFIPGWTSAGWRIRIPWRDLRTAREKHRGRQVLLLSAVGCSSGALWVDDESALRLAQHAGEWWHAPELRRELEQGVQTEWRAATGAVLAALAAIVAWFGAASAGVMTEWPRQRAFASHYVEVPGRVIKGGGDTRVNYQYGGYAGAVAVTSCAADKLPVGEPRTVYVSAMEPSRASLTVPEDPYTSRIPEIVLVLLVLPALAAVTARRSGLVVRRIRGAAVEPKSADPFWRLSLGELAKAAPVLLAVAVMIAAGLAHSGPPCGSESEQVAKLAALTGCTACQDRDQ